MNRKTVACWVVLASVVLSSCAGSGSGIASGSPSAPAAGASVKEVTATGTEQALLAALNAERQAAGKTVLTVSPVLAGLARGESDAAAASASAQFPGSSTDTLRSRSGFGLVGKLKGVLKDRGTPTGKGFVDYWAKDQRDLLLDDWSKVGVGISKAADGRLFAVAVFGSGVGGSSLMNPGMAPSGL